MANNKTALIFGFQGQDGYFLTKLLAESGIEVITLGRDNIQISNFHSVQSLVQTHQPAFIFDFAAKSSTRHDFLFENHETIATGSLNILEAVYRKSPQTKVFLSGSGLQFVNNELPIKENAPFEARDAYSVSRIQSVFAARYFRKLGVKAYVGYFFHHESPLRKVNHVSKMIAEAAKEIANGKRTQLQIGNLSVRKEWTFAGDAVEAVWALVNQDSVFEACLGSGLAYSILDWTEACFAAVQLDWRQHVVETPSFVPEYNLLVSDPSTIQSLGWQPRVSFQELASMFMRTD